MLAKPSGLLGDSGPARALRHVEPDQGVVFLYQLYGECRVLELLAERGDLVLVDVRQPLQEDQREDVVLELRGINRTADLAGGLPEPRCQGALVQCSLRRRRALVGRALLGLLHAAVFAFELLKRSGAATIPVSRSRSVSATLSSPDDKKGA